jgi:NADPH:quinone reductase-like Zn-dependent oxidoreductase
VVAVALNPCDFKMPYRFPSPGATSGNDFAGVVVAVGPNIAKPFKIGDRVFGAVYGANPIDHESGAFAQYLRADPEFTFNMPDSMSFETAASIGASVIATLGLALFRALRIPFTPEQPAEKPKQVLVWGGSTTVGTMAIQLLRM